MTELLRERGELILELVDTVLNGSNLGGTRGAAARCRG